MKLLRSVSVLATSLVLATPAFAAEAATSGDNSSIAAAIAIALAVIGGAYGQGKIGAAAMDAIGRNPGAAEKLSTPMIIGLALVESLVVYALVIAAKLAGIF